MGMQHLGFHAKKRTHQPADQIQKVQQTDSYGFDARPAGDINYLGTFNNAGTKAQWWTTNYVGLQGIKRTIITNQIGVPSSLTDQRAA